MASKYAQVEELHANYKNHPMNGLKICEKRLSRDPNNVVFTVHVLKYRSHEAADHT